jgi:hypothetical protein
MLQQGRQLGHGGLQPKVSLKFSPHLISTVTGFTHSSRFSLLDQTKLEVGAGDRALKALFIPARHRGNRVSFVSAERGVPDKVAPRRSTVCFVGSWGCPAGMTLPLALHARALDAFNHAVPN